MLLSQPFTNPDMFVINENQIYNRAKWKMVQAFATKFWNRFVTDYIPSLTIRKKWNIPQRNFKIGNLVLVFENADQKNASIVEIMPGKDGTVSTVKIKTRRLLYRSFSKTLFVGRGSLRLK